jgi:hypothetical protein
MSHPIEGKFEFPLFSPKGGIEGLLINVNGDVVQLTIDKEAEQLSALVEDLENGQTLVVDAAPFPHSHKGESEHSVLTLKRVLQIDGVDVKDTSHAKARKFRGKVIRLNYARHGEANGLVLDSGDFIHLKPDGFIAAQLSIGDVVEARGPTKRLVTGNGFVVEAQEVNGKTIAQKGKKKTPH